MSAMAGIVAWWRAQAERPRPIADLGGSHGGGCAAQHARPRAARGRARLPPLLAGRASRRPDARRAETGGADRSRGGCDAADPLRERRRDAAAVLPVLGG